MQKTERMPKADPKQTLERTSFQTAKPWDPGVQLGSDVAMYYGIGPDLGARIASWKAQGYRVHVMTGVSWGEYQDYLYGRFDGVNHEAEAQTERSGKKISHGGDVYYLLPGKDFGKFLCQGVERALEARAEGIHLEEPKFWARGGWSEGFKREWRAAERSCWTWIGCGHRPPVFSRRGARRAARGASLAAASDFTSPGRTLPKPPFVCASPPRQSPSSWTPAPSHPTRRLGTRRLTRSYCASPTPPSGNG